MNLAKLGLVVSAFALVVCLAPNVGWSTRVVGPMITGEVTATPQNGEIEVAHHLYHVKANSAADKALSGFYAGQTVDLVLDGAATNPASEVISITPHSEL